MDGEAGRQPRPNWRDASSYDYTRDLTREGWAWEFLRRNQDYVLGAVLPAATVQRVLRHRPLVLLIEITEITEAAHSWGLQFFRVARPTPGFRLRVLAVRCQSRRSAGGCASGFR
jgi:transcriptional regulator